MIKLYGEAVLPAVMKQEHFSEVRRGPAEYCDDGPWYLAVNEKRRREVWFKDSETERANCCFRCGLKTNKHQKQNVKGEHCDKDMYQYVLLQAQVIHGAVLLQDFLQVDLTAAHQHPQQGVLTGAVALRNTFTVIRPVHNSAALC